MFTFLALWTGALWGKPTWGTWWVWDARLTSELILLFLYLGFIALVAAIDDARRADRAGALLAIVGVVNVPIIYFSVQWWNTLHQGATISAHRRAEDGQHDADRDAADDAGLLGLRLRRRLHARAGDRPRARAGMPTGSGERALARRGTGNADMNWNSAAEFFAMGGYGLYVWGSYAVTLRCMAIEPVLARSRHRARADAPRAADEETRA